MPSRGHIVAATLVPSALEPKAKFPVHLEHMGILSLFTMEFSGLLGNACVRIGNAAGLLFE